VTALKKLNGPLQSGGTDTLLVRSKRATSDYRRLDGQSATRRQCSPDDVELPPPEPPPWRWRWQCVPDDLPAPTADPVDWATACGLTWRSDVGADVKSRRRWSSRAAAGPCWSTALARGTEDDSTHPTIHTHARAWWCHGVRFTTDNARLRRTATI